MMSNEKRPFTAVICATYIPGFTTGEFYEVIGESRGGSPEVANDAGDVVAVTMGTRFIPYYGNTESADLMNCAVNARLTLQEYVLKDLGESPALAGVRKQVLNAVADMDSVLGRLATPASPHRVIIREIGRAAGGESVSRVQVRDHVIGYLVGQDASWHGKGGIPYALYRGGSHSNRMTERFGDAADTHNLAKAKVRELIANEAEAAGKSTYDYAITLPAVDLDKSPIVMKDAQDEAA